MLADADELASKDACLGEGLLGLVWVSLGAFGGLEDEGFGLLLNRLELEDVSVELAGVVADQLVAFTELGVLKVSGGAFWRAVGGEQAYLCGGIGLPEDGSDRLHGERPAAGD